MHMYTAYIHVYSIYMYLSEEVSSEGATLNGNVPEHPLLVGLLEDVLLYSTLTHQPDIRVHTHTPNIHVYVYTCTQDNERSCL